MAESSMRLTTENRRNLKRLIPDMGETYDEVISNLTAKALQGSDSDE